MTSLPPNDRLNATVWLAALVVVAPLIFLVMPSIAQAEIRYHVTDLSTIVGGQRIAWAINNAGQVVGGPAGGAPGGTATAGFLWDAENGVTPIPGPPLLSYIGPRDISETGIVAGSAAGGTLAPAVHAFAWHASTGNMETFTFSAGSSNLAYARGVNDAGLVVGFANNLFQTAAHGFVWDSTSGVRPLEDFSSAVAVNNSGQIAGQGFDPTPGDDSTGLHALLLDPTQGLVDLGTFGDETTSGAFDINDAGQVVGLSGPTVFVWEDGAMDSLPSGVLASVAPSAINNRGDVVGFGRSVPLGSPGAELRTNETAVLWQSGELHQLNDLIDPDAGWHLRFAEDINDHGQIVGYGIQSQHGNQTRAFLLTPIATPQLPGDFNADGAVDVADYVVWRKNFSDDPIRYDEWRANFGRTLSAGSGSALPSAEPLSAAVPEPATIALLLFAAAFRFRTALRSMCEQ